jgi:hypothetical protein
MVFVQDLVRKSSSINVVEVERGGDRLEGPDPFRSACALNFFSPLELQGFFF